jgi:hypothetical protein
MYFFQILRPCLATIFWIYDLGGCHQYFGFCQKLNQATQRLTTKNSKIASVNEERLRGLNCTQIFGLFLDGAKLAFLLGSLDPPILFLFF